MRTIYIYGLCDPDTNEVMYVGKTVNPDRRMIGHLTQTPTQKSLKDKWIQSLLSVSKKPVLVVLEDCTEQNWVGREDYWMNHFKAVNPALTNVGQAGLGAVGGSKPGEVKKTKTNIELSPSAIQLREGIANKLDITKSAVIEMALRVLAEREGIKEE